ncbi:MAG: choice-of-anchor D domain-containing protein [Bradymonadales bacterium]|nr:choice-of-anchor D domain-containing protein [Bradymonadales bacterium]
MKCMRTGGVSRDLFRSLRLTGAGLLLVLAGLLVAAHLSGCGDEGQTYAGVDLPELRIQPQVITFDQTLMGETDSRLVTVENTGGAELVISSYHWEGEASDFSVSGLSGMRLQGGQLTTFTITYSPQDEALDLATLVVESNGGTARLVVSSLGQAAILLTEPAVVELIADQVGQQVEQTVRVFNAGSEPFTLSSVSLVTGSPDLQMNLVDFTLPAELGVDQSVSIRILYTPSGRGVDEGGLLLGHDAANAISGQTVVPVTGSIRDPYLVVEPEFVAFGAVPLGTMAVEVVELFNEGEADLTLLDLYMTYDSSEEMGVYTLDGEEFAEGPYSPPYVIEPGESMLMEVYYTPANSEPDQATVAIGSNDPDFPIYRLDLGGSLDAPYLTVYPWELAFGSVGNGITRTLSLLVRNMGSQALELEEPVLGSDPAFSLVNDNWWPDELAPGDGFELVVAFTPDRDGGIASTLTISASNDLVHSPIEVPLNGFGAGEPNCALTPIPMTINFGTVPRGSTRTSFSRVLNSGTGECRITRVRMSPNTFGFLFPDLFSDAFSLESVSIPAGTVIGPGESFIVEAAYSPIAFTAMTETLGDTGSIEIDAVDVYDSETVQCGSVAMFSFAGFARACGVNLQARSGVAELAAIPSQLDFGLVTLGCNSQTATINVYNVGSLPVHINRVALESCTGEYTLTGVPPTGYELPNGAAPLPLYVTYRPASLARSTCELVIESDAEAAGRLVVPLSGTGTNQAIQTDTFQQISGRKVDVLFVVDNSGSMSEEQSNLANNFSAFIDEAAAWDSDYQLGVITTEPDEVFQGRNPGELIGEPRYLTTNTTNLEAAFTERAEVGASGDGARESGLEAATLALSDPLISDVGPCGADCASPYSCVANAEGTESRCGGYNRSFLREDASLELVFLSDEPDQSRGTTEYYIDFFRNIKGVANTEMLHASAIVGPNGGCEGPGGSATAGTDYIDVANATGGVVASICETDFGPQLGIIGNRAFGLRRQFVLSRIADPATVQVQTSGGSPMSGWHFDQSLNSVVFNSQAEAPDPGVTFNVTYTAQCF